MVQIWIPITDKVMVVICRMVLKEPNTKKMSTLGMTDLKKWTKCRRPATLRSIFTNTRMEDMIMLTDLTVNTMQTMCKAMVNKS